MFKTIRSRIVAIVIIALLAMIALIPRDQKIRTRDPKLGMKDTVVRRIPLKQGLDLQGGIHLALELDQSRGAIAEPDKAIDRALKVIRTRIDEFGVSEPLIQKVGTQRIVVELPGEKDPGRARDIVQRSAFLEFRITDMQQQFKAAIPAIDQALKRAGVSGGSAAGAPTAVDQLLRSRDSSKSDSSRTKRGGRGAKPDTTKKDTATTGTGPLLTGGVLFGGTIPGEFLVPEEMFPRVDSMLRADVAQRAMPRGLEILWDVAPVSRGGRSFRAFYAVERRPILTGEYLTEAHAQLDPVYNRAMVTFKLTRAGGRIFDRETGRHVHDYMAIVLDQRVINQPPIINSQIGQTGQIELGNSTLQAAQDLALVLQAGSLPAPLAIVDERNVGASLGADSIQAGIRAGVIATLAVILIMAIYYRVSGLLAVGGLISYVLFVLGGLAAFGATLTLPGLAGFVLSIGMAVDANVLIFERTREELQSGKSVRMAVDLGFDEALRAIIDTHATTLIAALFLFQFGTGPVKGFAVTLTIGIVASLLTAVFVTRTFFLIWLQRRPAMKELSI